MPRRHAALPAAVLCKELVSKDMTTADGTGDINSAKALFMDALANFSALPKTELQLNLIQDGVGNMDTALGSAFAVGVARVAAAATMSEDDEAATRDCQLLGNKYKAQALHTIHQHTAHDKSIVIESFSNLGGQRRPKSASQSAGGFMQHAAIAQIPNAKQPHLAKHRPTYVRVVASGAV